MSTSVIAFGADLSSRVNGRFGVIRAAQLKARLVGIVAALFKKGVKPPFITAVTRNPRNAVDP